MEKKKFEIDIKAPREIVWRVLWGDDTYPQWTAPFSEGSRAVTDWKEGSKILFLDAKGDGMVSAVAVNKPNEYMSVEHLGFVKDGTEDTTSEQIKQWAGAKENYTLTSENGITKLKVDMDIVDEYLSYFTETWPKALEKVKEISEKTK